MLLAALGAAACTSPLADDPEASGGRDRGMAERADPLPTTVPSTAPGRSDTAPARGSDGGAAAAPGGSTVDPSDRRPTSQTTGAPPAEPTTTTADADGPARFRRLAVVDDPSGDQGLEGPRYADARRLVIAGTDPRLRVAVVVGDALPATLAEGEVMGVGVDLFRDQDAESEYQLFAEGSSDGWFAYLDTPDGLVDYPGTFRLGGRRLELEVPWDAVGGRRRAGVALFVDWSRSRPTGVLAASSEDRAPDEGTAALAP